MPDLSESAEVTLVGFEIESYYYNETAPIEWERTRVAIASLHVVLFLYCVFLFVVLCYSYHRLRIKKRSQARKMVSLLLGLTGFEILECVSVFATQLPRLQTCTGVSSLLGSTYMFSAFCGFQILYIRAQLVLSEREKRMRRFSNFLYYVNYGIVCLGIVYPWLGTDSRFFGVYCTLVNPPWVTWLFLLASTSFSLSFLSLFVYPLLRHLHEASALRGSTEAHDLRATGTGYVGKYNSRTRDKRRSVGSEGQSALLQHTIRKNLFYSSASLATTVIHIIVVAVVATVVSYRQSPHSAHWAIVPYGFTAVDMLVNTWSMTMITTIWVPPSWKKFRAVYYCERNRSRVGAVAPSRKTTQGMHRTSITDTPAITKDY